MMKDSWTSSAAYDLRRFEETQSSAPPQLTVRTNTKKQSAPVRSPLSVVIFVALLITFFSMLLANNVTVIELGESIRTAEEQLAELNEQHGILANRLESAKNTVRVEEYAAEELGMGAIADYQVTYITLDNTDVISANSAAVNTSLGDILSKSMDGVLEYLKLR